LNDGSANGVSVFAFVTVLQDVIRKSRQIICETNEVNYGLPYAIQEAIFFSSFGDGVF
jgi:hypothetical protein